MIVRCSRIPSEALAWIYFLCGCVGCSDTSEEAWLNTLGDDVMAGNIPPKNINDMYSLPTNTHRRLENPTNPYDSLEEHLDGAVDMIHTADIRRVHL